MTADGKMERGNSDRLCGLGYPSGELAKKLKLEHKIDVRDCLVFSIEIEEPESRKVAKKRTALSISARSGIANV
jgi:hypothetical protein